VTLGFSSAAEFRMGERNEVVNKIDGPNARIAQPARKAISIETRVADVQVEPVTAIAGAPAELLQCSADERRSKTPWGFAQHLKQHRRGPAIENPAIPRMLHNRLRARREMLQISEADPVDARRATAVPSPPDEPRDVEQQGRVVFQRTS
jgi:hypothetical protein